MAIALILPGSLFVAPIVLGQETPVPDATRTPTPGVEAGATPTIDRLAPPPTVASPTQADEGAYIYWLHCQPCHGDQGQGLTEEWRMQYPEEDRNCWTSGCHGRNPYEGGFTIPTVVPAVIGKGSLARFETMGDVHEYVRVTMPFSFPGTLTEEEYLAITAYLAKAHGVWDGRPLDVARAHELRLQPLGTAGADASTLTPPALDATPMTPAAATANGRELSGAGVIWWVAGVAAVIVLLLVRGIGLWSRN